MKTSLSLILDLCLSVHTLTIDCETALSISRMANALKPLFVMFKKVLTIHLSIQVVLLSNRLIVFSCDETF